MRKLFPTGLVYLLCVLMPGFILSCDDDDDNDDDVGADADADIDADTDTDADGDPSDVPDLGDVCTGADDGICSGVCSEFGQLGWVCTVACEDEAECPEGSEGAKCNKQGFCRP
jgi:hypothetical protein